MVKSSLIVFKTSREGEPNYQLAFLNNISQSLLAKEPDMKKQFHKVCVKYYLTYLE